MSYIRSIYEALSFGWTFIRMSEILILITIVQYQSYEEYVEKVFERIICNQFYNSLMAEHFSKWQDKISRRKIMGEGNWSNSSSYNKKVSSPVRWSLVKMRKK